MLISIAFSIEDDRLRIINAEILENTTIDNKSVRQFRGNVIFQRGTMMLYTDEATHYQNLDEFHLTGSVKMIDKLDTLTCNNLIYFSKDINYLKALGDIRFSQDKRIIFSDSLFYWTDQDSGLAMGNVEMFEDDKNLVTEIFRYNETDGFRGLSFSAENNTNFRDGDRDINASIIRYNDDTQQMILDKNCSVSEENQELSGNKISIQYADSILQHITVSENASAHHDLSAKIREKSEFQNFRDAMNSSSMFAEFNNDRISKLQLIGMAETIYNVVDDSLLIGVNSTTGDTIVISFENEEMNRIEVTGGARGQFIPESGNTKVDSTVSYQAEYLDYHINEQLTYLEEKAIVSYQDTRLTSDFIEANWSTNLLTAKAVEDVFPTVTSESNEPMSGDFMEFDLLTKHGRVNQGKTRFNNGNYYGDEIFRDEPNIYHVDESVYTTCDNENPHYYFGSNKMKMVSGDRVVAKPLVLFIHDIPVVGIPFAVFPNKGGGRRSGWIMPSFDVIRGATLVKGLGYFWAPNDYWDALVKANFHDQAGIDLYGKLRYEKRYSFTGSLSSTLHRKVNASEITDIFSDYNQSWDLKWRHTHTIDPTQKFSVNATYVSSSSMYQDYGWDQNTRLTQKIESRANYSKNWPGTKNSMSVSLSDSYDLMAIAKLPSEVSKDSGEVYIDRTQTLPSVNFNHGQTQIFGGGKKSKWYNSIYASMSSNYTAQRKIGLIAENDSSWSDSRDYQRNEKITHSFSLSSPQTLFGWLTLNHRLSLKEEWIFKYREAEIDEDGFFARDNNDIIKYSEIERFIPRHSGSASISASTKLHGIFPVSIGNLEALRHVISPSIGISWRPDLSKPILGYDLGYFQKDDNGELFDKFAGSMIGSTSKSEQQSINFGLNNVFQAKVKSGDGYKKVDFLNWSLNSGYNAVADSLKFSTIRSSIRTNIPGGLKLDVSMTHDPYSLKPDTLGNYKRMDELLTFPRMTSMSASTSLKLKGGRFMGFTQVQPDTTDDLLEETDDDLTITEDNFEPVISEGNLWEASLSLRYSLSQSIAGNEVIDNETFWANLGLNVQVTENWKLRYSTRFDLVEKEMVSHSFDFYRPLHCWEFSFRWTPSGAGQGFFLKINIKNSDLKDIKLESRGGKSFWRL